MILGRPLRSLILAWFVLAAGVRAWIVAHPVPGGSAVGDAVYALWLAGFANDVLVLAVLGLPVLLVRLVVPRALPAAVTASALVALVFAVADLFFWHEFGSRADRLVFHYLRFPVEVAYFLEDQFYLSLYAIPLVIAVVLLHRVLRHSARALLAVDDVHARMAGLAMAALVVIAVVASDEIGPVRTGAARTADQAASQGLLEVFRALAIDRDAWQGVFPSLPAVERLRLLERPPPRAVTTTPRHVVLVVEESLAGEAWWDSERRARYMPQFDALRARGVYFDRLYSSGTRTTRGLEGVLHGFPPLPGIALNQRAGVERLPSLPRAFVRAGFETVFVYGGWPGFSGFARYWRTIGYRDVLTREDFEPGEFETSWGVADEMLFERVLAEMDQRTAKGGRVFLSTLTVSNHRPFDFPPGRVPFPSDDRRLEYAIAYADWALGDFMAKAATRAWYADTLFVVVPDHGPSPRGGGPIPLDTLRVPGLLVWPNGLGARTDETVASLVDVPATVAALAGLAPSEPFAGRDLLADRQPACTGAPVEYDYRLGWLTARGLTVFERNGDAATFRRDSAGVWQPTAVVAQDVRCAIAVFESAHALWTRRE